MGRTRADLTVPPEGRWSRLSSLRVMFTPMLLRRRPALSVGRALKNRFFEGPRDEGLERASAGFSSLPDLQSTADAHC